MQGENLLTVEDEQVVASAVRALTGFMESAVSDMRNLLFDFLICTY